MVEVDIITPLVNFVIIIGVVTGIGGGIIGFLLKNQKTIDEIRQQTMQNHKCIQRVEDEIGDHLKESDRIINQFEMKFQELNMNDIKYRDEFRTDMKQLGNRLEVLTEKVTESEKVHLEIKSMIRDQMNFFTDWIQRLEDVTRDRDVLRARKRRRSAVNDDTD